jgi:hypothetical protein
MHGCRSSRGRWRKPSARLSVRSIPTSPHPDASGVQDSDEDDTIANVPDPQAQREAWQDVTAHHQHLQEGDTW